MNIEKLKAQLKTDEGYSSKIYLDSLGYPTVGVGHLLSEDYKNRVGEEIDPSKIDQWFSEDVQEAVEDAKSLAGDVWNSLSEIRQEVLADMTFNLGMEKFKKFVHFWQAMRSYDYSRAADEMIDSHWYHEVGDRGRRLVFMMRHNQEAV